MAPKVLPMRVQTDELEHAVAFLKNRDGLDKSLKLMRYAAMLVAFGFDAGGTTGGKLRKIDESTAVARKFLRLGKFLQFVRPVRTLLKEKQTLASGDNVCVARLVSVIDDKNTETATAVTQYARHINNLALGSAGASLLYYFLEQVVWSAKVGLIRSQRTKKKVAAVSNVSELATYVFSLQIAWRNLRDAHDDVSAAEKALREHKKNDGGEPDDDEHDEDDEQESDSHVPFARRSVALIGDSERFLRTSTTGSPLKNASQRAVSFLKRIGRFETKSPAASLDSLVDAVMRAKAKRTLAIAVFAAEAADATACVGEVLGGERNPLRQRKLVAGLGLVSAACGVYEKWVGTSW